MKKTTKNMAMCMSLGMCFGVAIGTSLGTVFDNISIGISVGISVGLLLGCIIGTTKDNAINEQLEKHGYTITQINKDEDEYIVTIVDHSGEETDIKVTAGIMETELFSVGDVVFVDDEGDIEQAYDKENM